MKLPFLSLALASSLLTTLPLHAQPPAPEIGGQLLVYDPSDLTLQLGECAVERTDVHATIFGQTVRTKLQQTFTNNYDTTVTVKYLFPLPENSAVDEMSIRLGNRLIEGEIHESQEAEAIYDEAVSEGRTATILTQERANAFTQRVANVSPGETIVVEIGFIEELKTRDGVYTWTFPMVIGHRGTDDSTVTIPTTQPTHSITMNVDILTNHAVHDITSPSHEIDVLLSDNHSARVTLAAAEEIPNRDFTLSFRTEGNQITEGLVVHQDEQGTYLALTIDPPSRVTPEEILPREIIYVIDASGSMGGFPLETAKAIMRESLKTLGPDDHFNLLSFAHTTEGCFSEIVPNTEENVAEALRYLANLTAGGGTEMMPAVIKALEGQHDPNKVRLVCFMTDGYIGYEYELLSKIQENIDHSKVFSFGIGYSSNRYLLDQMATIGGGAVTYVSDESRAAEGAALFLERIHAPILTDIGIDWGGLSTVEVTPKIIPDLFDKSPLTVYARLAPDQDISTPTITVSGKTLEGVYTSTVQAGSNLETDAVPKLWARSTITDLMLEDLKGSQYRNISDELRQKIVDVSVGHRVLSDYTSFVAVEKRIEVDPETSEEIAVPVDKSEELAATATNDWLMMALGAAFAMIGSFIFVLRRRFDALLKTIY